MELRRTIYPWENWNVINHCKKNLACLIMYVSIEKGEVWEMSRDDLKISASFRQLLPLVPLHHPGRKVVEGDTPAT